MKRLREVSHRLTRLATTPDPDILCAAQTQEMYSHTRSDSAFGARLYTSYLEGSTIAVTGSVCRSVHNHADTQWLFGNSG
jgi:CelD/BcsL family acetyltransferase involved in cellulose biosynthesis